MDEACSGRTGGTLANRALTVPGFSPPMLPRTTTMAGYSCAPRGPRGHSPSKPRPLVTSRQFVLVGCACGATSRTIPVRCACSTSSPASASCSRLSMTSRASRSIKAAAVRFAGEDAQAATRRMSGGRRRTS
jgi:hypothetical protein